MYKLGQQVYIVKGVLNYWMVGYLFHAREFYNAEMGGTITSVGETRK